MQQQIKFMLFGSLVTLFSGAAQAHFFAESADCKAPQKPMEFFSDDEKQQFETKVDAYRSCLESFISKQNQAMQNHKASAEKTAAAWKQYAETVLKVTLKPAE